MSQWLEPVTLHGARVRLEPLSRAHVPALLEAGRESEVWRWMPVRPPATLDDMRAVVDAALAEHQQGLRLPFTIVAEATGVPVGSTSYLDIVPAHRRLEIGWTWLGRPWWRTALNTEAKLLLLTHAFDTLGALRVSLKTDHGNERSQAAIERLGARREGVLRAHYIRPDGSSRDTVYYSVLAAEWPSVREGLRTRLDG